MSRADELAIRDKTVQDKVLAGLLAQFDVGDGLATTEFVQRALGSFAGIVNYSANTVLSAFDVGKYVFAAANMTFTLPLGSAMPPGAKITIQTATGVSAVVTSQDGLLTGTLGNGVASITIRPASSLEFVWSGTLWLVVGGNAAAQLQNNGYQRLPSGLIIQWNSVAMPTAQSGFTNFLYPIAFPNAVVACALATNHAVSTAGYNTLTVANRALNGAQLLNCGLSAVIGANSATTVISIGY